MPEAAYVDSAESLSRVLKSAVVDRATADDHIIFATPVGKGWQIHAIWLQSVGGQSFILKSEGTDLTGDIDMVAPSANIGNNSIFHLPTSVVPHFRSVAAGDDIILTLSQAIQVNGWIQYVLTEQIT